MRDAADNAGVTSIADAMDIEAFTLGLIEDLQLLRAGKISVTDARARAELARQTLRAVGYVIAAQKYLSQAARAVGGPGQSSPQSRKRTRRSMSLTIPPEIPT